MNLLHKSVPGWIAGQRLIVDWQAAAEEQPDTAEAADAVAQRYGLAEGEWADAQLGWLNKLKRNPARAFQYGQALNVAHQQGGGGGV